MRNPKPPILALIAAALILCACPGTNPPSPPPPPVPVVAPAPPPPSATPRVWATRIFAGPNQYPPTEFAAYGIVAFRARATQADRSRYNMICEAYVGGLPAFSEVNAPIQQQMATVWPIESNAVATQLNNAQRASLCRNAIDRYGLVTSIKAIDAARRSGVPFNGIGPFLLAWSPPTTEGKLNALVLVADLSDVTTAAQAAEIFAQWSDDIQKDPDLWQRGWNIAKLRIKIQLWADRYGKQILKLFGGEG
jgi:hypothetical protein